MIHANRAVQVDDPWWPCILTLDGGGIRGYSSLLILKALMHEVWLWELRLDNEADEETDRGGQNGGMSDSPTTVPSQPSVNSPTRTTSISATRPSTEQGNQPEQVERKYGVSLPEPHLDNAEAGPAHKTIHKDEMTTTATAKKALSEEELLPCHYFDFMYGTSTGGLIATILGRLRMSVSEALDLYRGVGDDLFGKRRSNLPLMTKYHHEPLEKAVQDVVGARCHEHPDCDGKDDLHPWDTDRFDEIL